MKTEAQTDKGIHYHHILMAVEKLDKGPLKQALEMAKKTGAKLSLMHMLPHLSCTGEAYQLPSLAHLEEKLKVSAKQRLARLAKQLGMETQDQCVEYGDPVDKILTKAKRLKVDLIVMDNSTRAHMSPTIKAVLKKAPCDILALRTEPKSK